MTSPTILPLGDTALLIRFADTLSDNANRSAIAAAARLSDAALPGVVEVVPGLVSVLLRLGDGADFWWLSGESALMLDDLDAEHMPGRSHDVSIVFDGEDLADVAARLDLPVERFIERHNASPLRVLATGFAPGFVYCGLHPRDLAVPRREQVRPMVPAGTVLFAAGQTAIAATPIRTGWHVIGRTTFQNFDPSTDPPTTLLAGDMARFSIAT
jgi:KipI family sensor histidine kinase inhibitor